MVSSNLAAFLFVLVRSHKMQDKLSFNLVFLRVKFPTNLELHGPLLFLSLLSVVIGNIDENSWKGHYGEIF